MGIEFDYVTRRRSFDELAALARRAYQGEHEGEPRAGAVSPDIWRAFPRGYVAGWLNDTLIGCVQLWPLDRRRAGDFLVGARSEWNLTEADLATVCNSAHTIWHFAGLVMDPAWRGRGLAAHLFAESMVRWYRDLPWRMPVHFVALAESAAAMGFIRGMDMHLVRPADETADGHGLYARTLRSDAEFATVVRSARAAADRKGRLVAAT